MLKKPIRIILSPAGIVQAAKLRKQADIQVVGEGFVMSTQEYIRKVVEDVGQDEDFNSSSWVSVVEFVNANRGIVSGCLEDIKNYLKNGSYEEEIMKMLEEEEMAKLELQVRGNIIDQQEHQHKFDQEALILALEEEVRGARAGQEWQEK
ncbi:hypothetical protein Tco_0185147 [Tanacetum coccineum]